ncbi:MAG TPA: DUF6279 family lipoprotein [Gammaproteobacteria bacterium]
MSRFLLLLSLAVLTACSMANFAYDLAPRIAVRYVDDYLQLSNRQEADALAMFRERHALHARDELPRYHDFILETRAVLEDGLTREDVDAIFDDVKALAELGVRRTIPAAAKILDDLNSAQLDALEEKLQENAAEYREELDDHHKGRRLGETLEDIEEWIGTITDQQREMLTRELRAMQETSPMWLTWRIEQNERLIALLRNSPSLAAIEAFLGGYWLRQDGLPPELVASRDANRARYRDMIVALDASLSDEQRAHALERLAEYRQMVVDMMPDEVRTGMASNDEKDVRE